MTRFSMVLLVALFAAPATAADRPAKSEQRAVHCTSAPPTTGSHLRRRTCSPGAKKTARPVEHKRSPEKVTAKK